MKLDNQQKAILGFELRRALNAIDIDCEVNVDKYVEKDFKGIELIMVLKTLNEAGMY